MTRAALEVNDAGLLLLREGDTRPAPESPGLALFEGDAVRVGTDAAARSRLLPRAVHDHFWDPLGLEPLPTPFPAGLRAADLAHAHLRALRESMPEAPEEAFLAVPGFWTRPALGLLLNMARQAGFPVTGLVDSAVAAASFFARGDALLHLDLTRHRAVLTHLRANHAIERLRVTEAEGLGHAAFERTLVEAIARRFVQETRFDPLHSGASEQALGDALPSWLTEIRRTGTSIAHARAGRRSLEVELTREALAQGIDPVLRSLVAFAAKEKHTAETVILVSARAARVPGLLELLRGGNGRDVVELPADAAVAATLRLRESVRHGGDALPFVTRLPLPGRAPAEREGRRPTHLMNAGVAHALGEGLTLGTTPPLGRRGLGLRHAGVAPHHCSIVVESREVRLEVVAGVPTLLNGAPARNGTPLRAGDRLTLGESGPELQLVAVEDGA
jgi:hypothetical protein